MPGAHRNPSRGHEAAVLAYRAGRGSTGVWRLEGCAQDGLAGAVVIPALAEGEDLFATLESLAGNPSEFLERFLVVVVVNHRSNGTTEEKTANRATLEWLQREGATGSPLKLAWVDAAGSGRELPAKGGGVGLARKIGLDLALDRLDHRLDPLLVCLDADTLVNREYLPAIFAHFRSSTAGGAVIPFRHRRADSDRRQAAIDRYELFLRAYVLGLETAGSPYAFHTVGSAMACRAAAYVKMGGMNTREAGEDFYFLQQMCRIAGVDRISGAMVFPSPRPSNRVPFGTGRSITRLLAREPAAVLFYRTDCFRILKAWLSLAASSLHADGAAIHQGAAAVDPELAEYLSGLDFVEVWNKIRRNHPLEVTRSKPFHDWFDGLKTMKFIHHLSAGRFPRGEPEETLPDLLAWSGERPATGIGEQLSLLRSRQGR